MKADRFDVQAEALIQQLALSGEAFNDLPYVRREIAAALRVAAVSGKQAAEQPEAA